MRTHLRWGRRDRVSRFSGFNLCGGKVEGYGTYLVMRKWKGYLKKENFSTVIRYGGRKDFDLYKKWWSSEHGNRRRDWWSSEILGTECRTFGTLQNWSIRVRWRGDEKWSKNLDIGVFFNKVKTWELLIIRETKKKKGLKSESNRTRLVSD